MIIKSGKVFISEKNSFINTDIRVIGNKISEIGENLESDTDEIIIDATEKYVLPGFIDAHSHIGLGEEGIGWEGADYNEMTNNPITPSLRAIDGINPKNISFEEAIFLGGVTTACTGPGSANVIGGQFSTISLYGNIIDDMIIDEFAAMKCAFGENPKRVYGKGKSLSPMTRMSTAHLLRKTIVDTINYKKQKEKAEEKGEYFPINMDFEAMIPVIEGKVTLKAHAHRADDICTAIRIAKEFNLAMTIEHCTEGHLIGDKLKEAGYSVILGPTFGARSKVELINKAYEEAAILHEKGVKFALMTDHHVIPQHSLNFCAAIAVKGGLDEVTALNAITKYPAEILKIDHLRGEIKEGLLADIVIWDKMPLDIQAKPEKIIISGKVIK
ncbi:MAG: amidohydrolase [Sarcina sp.]